MRNHTFSICVGVLAAITIAGCGGVSEKDVIGNWTGKIDIASTDANGNGDVPAALEGMAEAFANMMTFDLELKKDHTFKMDMSSLPTEGIWELKGNDLTLTTEKVLGIPVNVAGAAPTLPGGLLAGREPFVLRVSRNGKTMTTVDPSGATSGELLFTRKDDS